MKNKLRITIISLLLLVLLVLYFYPFMTNKQCGEFYLCKVNFGVYTYDVTSEAGQGENTGYFRTNLRLYKKVGGFAEYLGLKDINCEKE